MCFLCPCVFERPIMAAIKHVECHTSSSISDNPAVTSQNIFKQMFGISCSHLVSYPSSHVTPWEKVMKNDWITFLMQENILPITRRQNTSEIIDHILQKAYYSIKFLNFSYTLSPVHEDNSFKLGWKNGF